MIIREIDIPHYTNELYHYGKLGMKWGQHRTAKKILKNTKKTTKSQIEFEKTLKPTQFEGFVVGNRNKQKKFNKNLSKLESRVKKYNEKYSDNIESTITHKKGKRYIEVMFKEGKMLKKL